MDCLRPRRPQGDTKFNPTLLFFQNPQASLASCRFGVKFPDMDVKSIALTVLGKTLQSRIPLRGRNSRDPLPRASPSSACYHRRIDFRMEFAAIVSPSIQKSSIYSRTPRIWKESRVSKSNSVCHDRRFYLRPFRVSHPPSKKQSFSDLTTYRFIRLLRAALVDVPPSRPLRLIDK